MAEAITVARPYARAVFEQAQATDSLGQWSEFLQVAAQTTAAEAMRALLANPKLSTQEKADFFLEICSEAYRRTKGEQAELPEVGRNFIHLLAENHRLTALADIAAIFEMLRAQAEKTVRAQLISAYVVSEQQRDKIAASLRERLQRAVILECAVDESLLGGAIIRAGDLVIDGSVRGQLQRLSAALQH